MKFWTVRIGFGLFVVRAATEEDAVRVALEDENGAAQYGHRQDDVTEVLELRPDGPAALLAEHYG